MKLKTVFGSHSNREIKRINPIVDKIESMREQMMGLSDEQLKAKTDEFKTRLDNGETLDDILPEAFATVREASRRVLGLEHYRVQLIGGIVLYEGRIAEMKTGEGKTLVAALPSYLMALKGRGVHVVTVNDYLAARDANEIGQIHRFLGLTVGCVLSEMKSVQRREQYACDITYITNNELGFDYLRDNMAVHLGDCVQRDLFYCIIDEVDSILIDEARTPLIISGMASESTKVYEICDAFVRTLQKGSVNKLEKADILVGTDIVETGDYVVDEKDKVVHLTEQGVKKAEKVFHIDNLADAKNFKFQHHINQALRAHGLMHKDKDYVVKNGEVLIVDEFTGRIMDGRRYSDGLHQAIEAKEHVEIKNENRTMATITLQNFFNKYEIKCGMTGTASTEAQEFKDIYHLDVVTIPTNKPVIRDDKEDLVYITKREKYQAIVKEVKTLYAKRQPVLVGTATIDVSEKLSDMLTREGIPHQVLNAKFHEKEAEIVSHAGEAGTVTIATNMAGRGTDIKLDDEARQNGGLYIIGTERHESRRIDNQLRGRSGRQGDPGTSQFYISLEDDVLRLFGAANMLDLFRHIGIKEGEAISHKKLSKTVEKAQEKIEGNNFGIRKNLVDFDKVNNEQREMMYTDRRSVLEGADMHDAVENMMESLIEHIVDKHCSSKKKNEWDIPELTSTLNDILSRPVTVDISDVKDKNELIDKLLDMARTQYGLKESEFTTPIMREAERMVLLRCIDLRWANHIDTLDQLRQGIGLVGYGQKDPVLEYRTSAYKLFDEMLESIQYDTLRMLFKSRFNEKDSVTEDAPAIDADVEADINIEAVDHSDNVKAIIG